jgi:ribosomal protein S18 acetylase RimI-like enzyme
MGTYNFSLANYCDLSEIMDLYHSIIGTPGCTWSLDYPNKENVESDINSQSLYILKYDDKIVAVAAAGSFNELDHLPWEPKKPCELARIGVNPTMQRQGVGTIILQNVINSMKRKDFDGIRMLVSKTNSAALSLYNKNGFEMCGETFMFGIDFYCYQMSFNSKLYA